MAVEISSRYYEKVVEGCSKMKAVILAAGKGTRLLPYSNVLPKPLMPIGLNSNNTLMSVIERLIIQIVKAKINEIIIVVNYKSDMIKDYLGNGANYNCEIKYVYQDVLDGNAGAFYRCQKLLAGSDVFITDCDNYLPNEDFMKLMRQKHAAEKADLTVAVARVKNIEKFAIIKVNKNMKPLDIFEKPKDKKEWGDLAKSGMMILSNKLAMQDKSISRVESLKENYTTTQIIKYCLLHPENFKIELCAIPGGFNDMGTWDDYLPILKKNLMRI
jgi:NDP-sugar pyrophosphorylase family protein